jgi:hypothetical protein
LHGVNAWTSARLPRRCIGCHRWPNPELEQADQVRAASVSASMRTDLINRIRVQQPSDVLT